MRLPLFYCFTPAKKAKQSKKQNTQHVYTCALCHIIANYLADFFTVVLRHGYMPSALRITVFWYPFLSLTKTLLFQIATDLTKYLHNGTNVAIWLLS